MLWVIWLIFALLFLILACYHWRASKKNFPPFHLPEIPYWKPTSGIPVNTGILDADIKKTFDNFGDGFNSYIDEYNKSSGRQNKMQACGYLLASLTAIFSIFFTA